MKLTIFLLPVVAYTFLSVINIKFVWTDSSGIVDTIPKSDKEELHVENLKETNDAIIDDNLKSGLKTDDEVVEREEEAIKLDGLNVAQMKEMRDKREKFKFQAEVDRMMKLIINSLYTNKEIFLRELISNASDALDKIRFMSITDPTVLNALPELSIRIKADKINNLLRISDTGIGMTRDDLVKQLGTIANSGTTEFLSKIEKEKVDNLGDFIGQFGVGFYSVYLVSESVTVISKHNDDDQYIWESDSSSTFTVTKDPRGNTLKRGTEIVLRLKPSASEFLEPENLKRLIRQYSQYLSFPIYLWSSKLVDQTDVAKTEAETTEKNKDKQNKPKQKVVWDWERINNQKPIWVRKQSEVTDEEYDDFYKVLSRSNDKPLAKIHFIAEGEVSFRALLYIPPKAPSNFLERDLKESSIRLYVRRVFITDKILDIIPRYLSFIIGIVDSDDLPLNVSRETLQQEKLMKVIQKKLVRKALDMIKKLSKEKYDLFWKHFRAGIKIGLIDDDTNRNRLNKLYRTYSSKTGLNMTSFADYLGRMKSQQEEIYLVCDESLDKTKSSPFVEKFIRHDYEVLYFTESLDEHALFLVEKYEGTKLLNLARGGIYFDKTEGNKAKLRSKKDNFKPLIDFLKNQIELVKAKIENILITDRLLSVPMMVTPQERGWTGNMERLARSQTTQNQDDIMIQEHLLLKKNLELNIKHPVIIQLNNEVNNKNNIQSDEELKLIANVLFESALINSGYFINDTSRYTNNLEEILFRNLKKTGELLENQNIPEEPEDESMGTVEENNESDKKETKTDQDNISNQDVAAEDPDESVRVENSVDSEQKQSPKTEL